MARFERPHFAFPFRRGSYVEQDTPEHIMACEQMIASCPIGYRDDRPEFGWDWPDLTLMPVSAAGLLQALNVFEPRARATLADAQALAASILADAENGVATINVNVQPEGSS